MKLVTQSDSVNQQCVHCEVGKPATRSNVQLAACSKYKFCYLIIATRQHKVFKKKRDFI